MSRPVTGTCPILEGSALKDLDLGRTSCPVSGVIPCSKEGITEVAPPVVEWLTAIHICKSPYVEVTEIPVRPSLCDPHFPSLSFSD